MQGEVSAPSRAALPPAGRPLPDSRRDPPDGPSCQRCVWRERLGFVLTAAQLLTVFGIAISNVLLCLAILATGWAAALPTLAARLRRRLTIHETVVLLRPVGLFCLFLAVSMAASYDPVRSRRGLSEIFALTSLLVVVLFVRGERRVRVLVVGLSVLGAALALAGLSEYLTGSAHLELDSRIRGPLSHYQTYAGVLLICDLFLASLMMFERRYRTFWSWAALVLINAALLGSLTRGAWIGLFVGVTILVLVRAPRYLWAYVPATLLFLLLAPTVVVDRARSIADLRDPSNYDRLCMAYAGVLMIKERPFFGQGPEMVEPRYPIYRHPSAPRLLVPHLHNAFLQLAAEQGLLSLGAYLWMCCASLYLSLGALRREGGVRGPRAALYVGSIVAVVAFNVAGIFEDNWRDREVQRLFLFALAVPVCLGREEAG